jgi:DNA-binding MarR family transcriptional regulator
MGESNLSKIAVIPKRGEGRRGEHGHLGYLLRQAAAVHRLRMERALTDLGVTPAQFSVLTMLAAYPGQSNADIARLSLLTPPTVTVIVSNLEAMGAISKKNHAVHGRILQIDLTKEGITLLARCRQRVQLLESSLEAGLSESELQAIRHWLSCVAKGMGN